MIARMARDGRSRIARGGKRSAHAGHRRPRRDAQPVPDLVGAEVVQLFQYRQGPPPHGLGHRLVPQRAVDVPDAGQHPALLGAVPDLRCYAVAFRHFIPKGTPLGEPASNLPRRPRRTTSSRSPAAPTSGTWARGRRGLARTACRPGGHSMYTGRPSRSGGSSRPCRCGGHATCRRARPVPYRWGGPWHAETHMATGRAPRPAWPAIMEAAWTRCRRTGTAPWRLSPIPTTWSTGPPRQSPAGPGRGATWPTCWPPRARPASKAWLRTW